MICDVCAEAPHPDRKHCWGVDCYHLAMRRIRNKEVYIDVHGKPKVLWVENYWLDRSTTGRE